MQVVLFQLLGYHRLVLGPSVSTHAKLKEKVNYGSTGKPAENNGG